MIAQNKPYPMMYVYTILKVNTASWLISYRILRIYEYTIKYYNNGNNKKCIRVYRYSAR